MNGRRDWGCSLSSRMLINDLRCLSPSGLVAYFLGTFNPLGVPVSFMSCSSLVFSN